MMLAAMANRYIFHLSIPVSDLTSAKRFYVEVLGATIAYSGGIRAPIPERSGH